MESTQRAGLKEWIGLGVLALPALLVSIDVSVMILALPHIGIGLGADSIQQLWIMDIYGFMLSGFLITMGTLGDRMGRRKLLLLGAACFGLASVLAAFSSSVGMLIAARSVLGVAGAAIAPSAMALIGSLFRDPKQRSLGYGIWFACSMGGMALGPVVGGAMLEHFSWGSVFLLGVPVMALLLVTGPLLLPEYRNPKAGRLDLPSVGLSLGAILPFIYGLKELAKGNPGLIPVLALGFGIALGAVFVRRQRSLSHPLLEISLFASPVFRSALGCMFGVTLTGAIMLFLAQQLQFVQSMTPLSAAMWMLPGVIASMTGMLLSPILARYIRPSPLIGTGLAIAAAGCVLLSQAGAGSGLANLVAGYILFSAGSSPVPSLLSGQIIGSAPPEKAGSAASLLQTSGEFAYALGIAVFGSIGAYLYRHQVKELLPAGLDPAAAEASRESLAGAVSAAVSLPDSQAEALLQGAGQAFSGGMQVVAVMMTVLMAGIAVYAWMAFKRMPLIGQTEAGGAELAIQESGSIREA
ncbi:MFS transporter [Paenibacillus sp. CC-CFT747]|nr:MFS transporter [Paenibacillus sp. CC-CFT747]